MDWDRFQPAERAVRTRGAVSKNPPFYDKTHRLIGRGKNRPSLYLVIREDEMGLRDAGIAFQILRFTQSLLFDGCVKS